VRFYWNSGTPRTVKCVLWKGGVAQKTVNVAVSGVGYYTGTFTAQAITRNEDWFATIWESSAVEYQLHSTLTRMPVSPTLLRDIFVIDGATYEAGDTEPLTVLAGAGYPVEPVITG
jgi:hypothetical protein